MDDTTAACGENVFHEIASDNAVTSPMKRPCESMNGNAGKLVLIRVIPFLLLLLSF